MSLQANRGVSATTLRIPNIIYEQAKQLVAAEETTAASLNDFFVNAIQAYVKLCERRRIDAEFAMMAEDVEYKRQAILIAEEFAASDWEALELISGVSTSESAIPKPSSPVMPQTESAFIPVNERLYRLIAAPLELPAGKQPRIILEILAAAKEPLSVDQISALAEARGLAAAAGVTPSCKYHLNRMVKEKFVEIVANSDKSKRKPR